MIGLRLNEIRKGKKHSVLFLWTKLKIIKMATLNISKKRKFVADGVFYSELNEVGHWNDEICFFSHKHLLPF